MTQDKWVTGSDRCNFHAGPAGPLPGQYLRGWSCCCCCFKCKTLDENAKFWTNIRWRKNWRLYHAVNSSWNDCSLGPPFFSSSIGYHLPAIHNLSGSGSGCSNDKCVESCKQDWEKSGDHCYIAICGVPTRRIGLPLKTSARGREATWRLSSRLPPSTLSWREWRTEEASTVNMATWHGLEATT